MFRVRVTVMVMFGPRVIVSVDLAMGYFRARASTRASSVFSRRFICRALTKIGLKLG
jgi:hypothetical protein